MSATSVRSHFFDPQNIKIWFFIQSYEDIPLRELIFTDSAINLICVDFHRLSSVPQIIISKILFYAKPQLSVFIIMSDLLFDFMSNID